MRIRVQRRDGRIEVLTISEDTRVVAGPVLHRLSDGRRDDYFTPEGYYDGWGMGAEEMTPEQAADTIAAIEGARIIIERNNEGGSE